MVTGVSLKGADAALVLMQEFDGSILPVSFAIKGTYDRLGAIDGIEEDEHARDLLRYFLDREQGGELVIEEAYLRIHEFYPFDSIEQLLHAFERNIRDNPRAALLNRKPVVFGLIARPIWDEIANTEPVPIAQAWKSWEELQPFNRPQLYTKRNPHLNEHVVELATLAHFLRQYAIPWKPAYETSQDYSDDMREYLRLARERFARSPLILTGLRDYERQVGDLLEDE